MTLSSLIAMMRSFTLTPLAVAVSVTELTISGISPTLSPIGPHIWKPIGPVKVAVYRCAFVALVFETTVSKTAARARPRARRARADLVAPAGPPRRRPTGPNSSGLPGLLVRRTRVRPAQAVERLRKGAALHGLRGNGRGVRHGAGTIRRPILPFKSYQNALEGLTSRVCAFRLRQGSQDPWKLPVSNGYPKKNRAARSLSSAATMGSTASKADAPSWAFDVLAYLEWSPRGARHR